MSPKKNESKSEAREMLTDIYGENVFSLKVMRDYLSDAAFKSLSGTIRSGATIDPRIADEVADAMKIWALERGATHYTHWFQPLTGTTAEKHDSFIVPDGEGGAIAKFSGEELIQGEPDASSFPSGGLRATFEARGYTAWDPTSPAFIKEDGQSRTLCIPTVFCGYHGEALDKKTPLLRSMKALNTQICRLAKLFGVKSDGCRVITTLGSEQEYFLIDKELHEARLDLLQCGRTLFGRSPAKHQQLEDHYFGAIKSRVVAFMTDLDRELWRLGVPARTRHNEVCPGQFEIAPMFEELNLAVDHNMLTMEIIRRVAEEHGFACLLHEKPFAGVNGSGKHNNWSICGPDGKNWLSPGDDPHENAKFLTVICALIKAVDTHADLLRAAVASPGNDHRLGANEAPPAIISIFLGEQLTDIIDQIEKGGANRSHKGGMIELGVDSIPPLPRGNTDRNRTSPFAFTGNKFEFRAVGSEQNPSAANVVLNTIMAEALDEICTKLEKAGAEEFNAALQSILSDIIRKHKRVLFNGDGYTDEWVAEAERRGLPNLKKTPEALASYRTEKAKALFSKYRVLSERELASRYEVYIEAYHRVVKIEARCAVTMARTMIAPAAIRAQTELAGNIKSVKEAGGSAAGAQSLLEEICRHTEMMLSAIKSLESRIAEDDVSGMISATLALREPVDELEGLLPDDAWPLPSYAEMLFMM
ncbi:MAG TPA: glutamine synthetase III [Kiritimatiellia bacterium]|nr:glutamine synthetase III [Kiritimatiellia bacterium]HNS80903.1 glutamine synthetase III [Kiritimatiellia bacterium]HPA77401.1 glutamine synthetase III [Kiritimatiellia bacterium]HQQ03508.1 glutamine synthetase III [Kiritimatiellia bacterium]